MTVLTPRDLDLLRCFAAGLGTGGTARALYWGRSTVKVEARRLYRKLGAANREQAVAIAVRVGIIA